MTPDIYDSFWSYAYHLGGGLLAFAVVLVVCTAVYHALELRHARRRTRRSGR